MDQSSETKDRTRVRARGFSGEPRPLNAPPELAARFERNALEQFRYRKSHPLLRLHVRQIGEWRGVAGFDPVARLEYHLLTKAIIRSGRPTFIVVDEPGRITCTLEQIFIDNDGNTQIETAKGWLGVSSLSEARTAKLARGGDPDAMHDYAVLRSLYFLRRRTCEEALQFMDVEAARYWFTRAAESVHSMAGLKLAYLEDLLSGLQRTPVIDAAIRTIWENAKQRMTAFEQLCRLRSEGPSKERRQLMRTMDACGTIIRLQMTKVPGKELRDELVRFLDQTEVATESMT